MSDSREGSEATTNGTRTWTLIIVLIIGLAVGWLIGRSAPPAKQPSPPPVQTAGPVAGDHLLYVGPKAENVGAVISKSAGHMVFWKTRDVDANVARLRIVFKKSDWPPALDGTKRPPFENGDPNQDQTFECDTKGTCRSGKANPELTYPPNSYYYKYWQYLLDASGNVLQQADAGIIIER